MAIVLPMLMLVIAGIIDFGRFFLQEIQLTNAAREGARVAVIGDPDIEARARAAAPGIPGMSVTIVGCVGAGDPVEVTAADPAFEWIILEPMMAMFPGGSATSLPDAKSTAAMRCEV